MKKWFVILFIISTSPRFAKCNPGPGELNSSFTMLQLKIKIAGVHMDLNQPLPVKITLTNMGNTPVLVNKRLSIGYEKSLSRELYADIKNLDTGQPAKYFPNDINRDFSVDTDYKSLLPGDSISTTFNLLEYYPLQKSGQYELTVYYQTDEPLANVPVDIWKGVLSSEPVKFELMAK